jgi:hypothetical protein
VEAEWFEASDDFICAGEFNYAVEIAMRTRLLAEKGIDSPSAIQPDWYTGAFEAIEDPDDVGAGHLGP